MQLLIIFWCFTPVVIYFISLIFNYFFIRSNLIVNSVENHSQEVAENLSQRETLSKTEKNRRKNARKKLRKRKILAEENLDDQSTEKQLNILEKSSDDEESEIKNHTDEENLNTPQKIPFTEVSNSNKNQFFKSKTIEDEEISKTPSKIENSSFEPKKTDSTSSLSKIGSKNFDSISKVLNVEPSKEKKSLKEIQVENENKSNHRRAKSKEFSLKPMKSSISNLIQEDSSALSSSIRAKPSESSSSSIDDFHPVEIKKKAKDQNFREVRPLKNIRDDSSESDFVSEKFSSSMNFLNSRNRNSALLENNRNVQSSSIRIEKFFSALERGSLLIDDPKSLLNESTANCQHQNQIQQQDLQENLDHRVHRLMNEKNQRTAKLLHSQLEVEKNRIIDLLRENEQKNKILEKLQEQSNLLENEQKKSYSNYKMELNRLNDEHNQLLQQLQTLSMMPITINELQQQEQILIDEIQFFSSKNRIFEKQIIDEARAMKHVDQIYRKAETQKQEQIEELILDLNSYLNVEEEFNEARERYEQRKGELQSKFDLLISQFEQLKEKVEKTRRQIESLENFKIKHEKCAETQNQENSSTIVDELKRRIWEASKKHESLSEKNRKLLEKFNKINQEKIRAKIQKS